MKKKIILWYDNEIEVIRPRKTPRFYPNVSNATRLRFEYLSNTYGIYKFCTGIETPILYIEVRV